MSPTRAGLLGLDTAARRTVAELRSVAVLARSGLIAPIRPDRLVRMGLAVHRSGLTGGLIGLAAARHGDRTALIDELGAVSFRQLDERTNAIANTWRDRGLRDGATVAVLARNHRGFHYAVFAAAKCGARIVLLNTDFAAPQLREVCVREGADLLVYDDEYAGILGGLELTHGRYRAWSDESTATQPDTLDALIATGRRSAPKRVTSEAKIVLLTSGTTGTPKGAARPEPRSLVPLGAIFDRIPFHTHGVIECPAPLFHTFGFAHALLAVGLGSTLVVRRRFDAQATIDSVARNRATALIAVPVMIARMVELGPAARRGRDLSALRIIFVAGSQLGSDLCLRAVDAFGPVLYNLYGSTEVAYATIATPADLAAEPACVGKITLGAEVRIYDADDKPVAAGISGRIYVGNSVQFEGYTGGGDKRRIDGLMSSGDIGHFDSAGRLFIDGRDDDMIVSGGENVFPNEIEELLASHPGIEEVAAFGVDDAEYGQRLHVCVVVREGHTLGEDEVKAHVRAHLARFKTPREVSFLDSLPRNPTGKILKRQLRETYS